MSQTILLVAGGTGGHVFPAIALAEVLVERGFQVEFITDKRGQKFFDGTNIFPSVVACSQVPSDWKGRLLAALKIGQGIIQSLEYCREYEPSVVVGFGGYPSFPTMFAAQLLKLPTIVHEANAIFGRASRQVAERTKFIATSFPETRNINLPHQPKTIVTGNPIRKVFSATATSYALMDNNSPFHLLIFGGSQGSSVFSKVPEAIERLPPELRQRLVITQQCRAEDKDAIAQIYNRLGVNARLEPFFRDIPNLYAQAHLVISRAGASTVAEITAMGRPSILVPLAASLDGDQAENAQSLAKQHAAWVMPEKDFTAESLAAKLGELLTHPEQLANAAQAAQSLGKVDAAGKLADLVLKAAQK